MSERLSGVLWGHGYRARGASGILGQAGMDVRLHREKRRKKRLARHESKRW